MRRMNVHRGATRIAAQQAALALAASVAPNHDASRCIAPSDVNIKSGWRRDATRAGQSRNRRLIHFPPGVGEPAHVLPKQPCGIDERRERREIARAGVQAQQVETNALERRDALCQVCRGSTAPRLEHIRVNGAGRGERREHIAATVAGSSASCSRYAFGSAAKSSDAATPSAASVARNAPPPTARECSGAPRRRANHCPARLFQRRSRIPVCHPSRIRVGMNCTSSALLTAPSSIVLNRGTRIHTAPPLFS
jgi:hypothetical protein